MKYSKKGLEKRKADREGFAKFFQRHIEKIKSTKAVCRECGSTLKGHVSEIAHVLPKSYYKSIATNDKNVIYLCGMYSNGQCHTNFDTFSNEKMQKMLIFSEVSRIFTSLEEDITEKIPYKTYDRYTL